MLVPQVQLFDALHRGQSFLLQKKRVRFFWGVFIGAFFPSHIITSRARLIVSRRHLRLGVVGLMLARNALSHYLQDLHYRFPEYIAPLLNGFSIFCLANQNSAWFTRIFGGAAGNEGLGMFALSLDWNYIGSGGGAIGSLFTPLSVQLSLYGAFGAST